MSSSRAKGLSSTWKKKQVLCFRLWTCTNHSLHRKPTQSGCYFNYSSNHPLHMKRRVIHSLCIRATIIWQKKQGLTEEMDSVNRDLQLSNYPVRSSTQLTALPWKWVIQKVRECYLHWRLYLMKSVSEELKCIVDWCNIRTVFKTKHTFRF